MRSGPFRCLFRQVNGRFVRFLLQLLRRSPHLRMLRELLDEKIRKLG
jgi:hypothetical protein